jgi:hypothetical protein
LFTRHLLPSAQATIKLASPPFSRWKWIEAKGIMGRSRVYPSVHFLNRQAAREKLAAMRALTEAARQRHLSLAEDYAKRADSVRAAIQA